MVERVKTNDDFCHVECRDGHKLVEQIIATMAGSLFNAFTANYVKEVNSEVHALKSKKSSRPVTRDQSSAKIRKLTGGKWRKLEDRHYPVGRARVEVPP